jgi:hypothetical protein
MLALADYYRSSGNLDSCSTWIENAYAHAIQKKNRKFEAKALIAKEV